MEKIIEELKRIKLLTNYNTKLTLTENYDKVGDVEILDEQKGALRKVIRADAALAKTLSKELDTIMGKFKGGITSSEGALLKNGDDIINALKKGTLKQAELGKLNTNLFRETTNASIKSAVAKDMVNTKSFSKAMSEVKTEKEAVKRLMNGPKKFTQEEAEFLVKEYKATGKSFGEVIATTKTSKPKTRKAKNKQSTFKNWRKSVGKAWSSMSRTKKILLIAGSGLGVYLLWRYFKDEDPGIYSDCVLSYMSDEDLAKMASLGFGEGIIISETPNRQINAMGGVKLFTNGKLESVSGDIKGTWSSDGTSISVEIGGQSFSLPCQGTKIEDTDEPVDNGSSQYKLCSNPPFDLYCKNDLIKKVQGCLGVKADGYLGPITQTALKNVGVELPLNQAGIDKACKSSQSVTPTPEQPTPEQQYGTSGSVNTVGDSSGQTGVQTIDVNINDI